MDEERIYKVARVCHEANRAYCLALGDNSQQLWENAPGWQQNSAIAGVRFHLESPIGRAPNASHENWVSQKTAEGWVWGPEKSEARKEHHCLVPFERLPPEQQAKDVLFGAIVEALRPWATG